MKQSLSNYHSHLRIGTCSWKYDSWKGLIYEAEKDYKPYDYLTDYAKHYAKQSSRYKHIANQPNPHFLNIDLLKRFLETLQAMEKKLGPVMFQFEYLNRQKMPSLNVFIEKLSDFFEQAPKEFEYAVEIRNPNYLEQNFLNSLKDMSISPVLLEGYYMLPISKVTEELDISSDRPLIIRLRGPDRQKIEKLTGEKWDRIVAPKDESLNSVADIIEQNIGLKRKVFVNVNNHYEGCAVLTIERLMNILQ